MAKVSVGLRGWRFDEADIFDEAGEFKPLDDIPEDQRKRLIRLSYLVEEPCDACYLVHGEADKKRCNQATIVYGEPGDELLLCDRHEPHFLYWFREEGGGELAGEEEFRDEFHLWFADGGRAPEDYVGMEYVETDPDELPTPPDANELHQRLNENFEGRRIEIIPKEEREAMRQESQAVDTDDLDLDTEYPTK